ncbi:MAG: hypothetical protein H7X95_02195 [Deltaproteobacteria bacterium]|nr:hypothetical protein [Deltaproteobacteria bacterium]
MRTRSVSNAPVSRSSVAVALGFACAFLLFSARTAQAYPQFQFSSGTSRCAQCHYSPAGYGLLTSWGRDESADTISRGGDGAFLHGLWSPPDWLALGGDIRMAALRNDVGGAGSPESAVFPMQAELYGRVAFGDSGVSLYVAGGARSATRPAMTGGTVRVVAPISREHFLMWKPSATGAYVRAGRFYAPFGLRMAEHIYFVRRFTGFNLYEETYNVSGGYLEEDWEVHATAFAKPPAGLPVALQSSGMRGAGGAVYAEKRFASIAGVGLQGRVMVNNEQRLSQGGAVGKVWVEQAKMMVMSEVNLQRRDIVGGAGFNQMVAFFGLTFIPIKGVMAGIAAERYQEDLRLATTARNAFDLQINLFPWAHCEIFLLGRYQMSGSGRADGDPGSLGMLQLHYYL